MRLIKTEDALKELCRHCADGCYNACEERCLEFRNISNMSGVEVEPVKHDNPLTIDELRTMHGKPVWIEQENTWGIVSVDNGGLWKDIPYVVFFFKNIRCEYCVEERGLTCYHHEPVKHGRWVEKDLFSMYHKMHNCSECGEPVYDNGKPFNYCPNCGAKMDGGAEND